MVSPVNIIPPFLSILFWGRNNKPVRGSSSETQVYLIDMINPSILPHLPSFKVSHSIALSMQKFKYIECNHMGDEPG
jgi:hypothetical protein